MSPYGCYPCLRSIQGDMFPRKSCLRLSPSPLAHPLKRAIQKELENPLGKAILSQQIKENSGLLVDVADGRLTIRDLAEVAA